MKLTKPLFLSKSWWSVAGLLVTSLAGVDWESVVKAVADMAEGSVPPEWGPVVQLAAALILAILGAIGVITRKQAIRGIF